MTLLEKLTKLMAEQGLNKRKLSMASGIPYSTIDGLYKKGYKNIRYPTLRKLSDFFGVTMEFLSNDSLDFDNKLTETFKTTAEKENAPEAVIVMHSLKNLREQKGVSQTEVARYLGVSRQAYSFYESGLREASYEMLLKLGEYFDVSLDVLLGRVDKKKLATMLSDEREEFYLSLFRSQTQEKQEEAIRYLKFLASQEDLDKP